MKQVEFDIELVKKIQSGEVKGRLRTREGRAARFLGEIHDDTFPLVFARHNKFNKEYSYCCTIDGFFISNEDPTDHDIILEIEDEEKKQEHQFKPFDKVLVRGNDIQEWRCSLFSHNAKNGCGFIAAGLYWKQCIPYEGNEHLLGTTNKPQED